MAAKYGNLFDMYQRITDENPYQVPMRIFPAPHYTMGGLWGDYNLMSTVEGLFVSGEANFSDHGANRLGASALRQGLADGDTLHPLQSNFINHAALQCGVCTPGFLMAGKALLDRNPNPSDEEIRFALAGNLCRCTGYDKIVRAVKATAKELRKK